MPKRGITRKGGVTVPPKKSKKRRVVSTGTGESASVSRPVGEVQDEVRKVSPKPTATSKAASSTESHQPRYEVGRQPDTVPDTMKTYFKNRSDAADERPRDDLDADEITPTDQGITMPKTPERPRRPVRPGLIRSPAARHTSSPRTPTPQHTRDISREGTIQEIILKSQMAVEKKLDQVTSAFNTRLQETAKEIAKVVKQDNVRIRGIEQSLQTLALSFAHELKSKEGGKKRMDVALAPLRHIYSKTFYKKGFTSLLFKHILKTAINVSVPDVFEGPDDEDLGGGLKLPDEEGEEVLRALMFSIRPNERRTEALCDTVAARRLRQIRIDITYGMISIAQSNSSIGSVTISHSNASCNRPFWLNKRFVNEDHVMNVIETEEGPTAKTPRKKKTEQVGVLLNALREKDVLADEIVRRVNQIHTLHLNKARELARTSFYVEMGFLWETGYQWVFEKYPTGEDLDGTMQGIPSCETTMNFMDCEKQKTANILLWTQLLEDSAESMKFYVSYKVKVKDPVTRVYGEKMLYTAVHMMQIALQLLVRLTGNALAEDVMVFHKGGFKVIFLIACSLRHILLAKIHQETEMDLEGNGSEVKLPLAKVLTPPSSRVREDLLQEYVLKLSLEEYTRRNIRNRNAHSTATTDSVSEGFPATVTAQPSNEAYDDSDDDVNDMLTGNFE